jgi:hypothetical protein
MRLLTRIFKWFRHDNYLHYPEWIDTKDRLPDHSFRRLLCTNGLTCWVGFIVYSEDETLDPYEIEEKIIDEDFKWYAVNYDGKTTQIYTTLFWMELPKSPLIDGLTRPKLPTRERVYRGVFD